ncbi:integral membrane protein [Diplocarpon rosae]|nr:integral membrane protein [Diplocarpon rosae]
MAQEFGVLDPLPLEIRNGMIAMGVFGLVSTVSTLSLIVLVTYRMVFWRKYYDHPIASNQVFILIYNLLLADFQQALSFIISFYWISQNKLEGPSTACFIQGWLIQIGDVSSGLWVLAIATHTFFGLVYQRTLRHREFVAAVVLLWTFSLLLTVIGPIFSKDEFFVPAGAWCWINEKHEAERLYLHYLWIFIAQLGSLVTYISIFFSLRSRLATSSTLQNTALSSMSTNASTGPHKSISTTTTIMSTSHNTFAVSRNRIMRTARYMVVYPFAYVFLTLPLAAGRIASMVGRPPPLVFFLVAGTLMASCGIVDVLLYLSTRKALVRSSVGARSPFQIQTNEASRKEARSQSFALKGLNDDGDHGVASSPSVPRSSGTIVVSKSIFMSADPERSVFDDNLVFS